MADRTTKADLLAASDLEEKDIDLPSIKSKVRIRAISAHFSAQATSEALEMTETQAGQKVQVNTAKLNAIKVEHGLIDPKLDAAEAIQFLKKNGRAGNELVEAINELSGITDDEVEATEARFPAGD